MKTRTPIVIHGWLTAILLLGSVLSAQDAESDANAVILRRQFFEAFERNEVEKGIELGIKADEAKPGDALIHYNLARLYARSGNKERATHWFDLSTRNGFVDAGGALIDPDLVVIREEPRFKDAIARIQHSREVAELGAQLVKLDPKEPLIVLPPSLDSQTPAPLFLLVEGGALGPEGMAATWKDVAAERGAIIIAPFGGYAYPGGPPMWGPAKETMEQFLKAVELAKSRHKIDPQQIVIVGFAQGGKHALITAMRNPEVFKGVISHSGEYDSWLAQPPSGLSKSSPIRVFLGVGETDGTKGSNTQAETDYRHAGVPTRLVEYPKLGTAYPDDRVNELRKAVDWILGTKR